MQPGTLLTLDVEKPAAGGRMLARHHGQIVLVWGAIPGERVTARVERIGKGVIFADTAEVLSASPDRRGDVGDWRCGGNVLAFIAYPRQLPVEGPDHSGRARAHRSRPAADGAGGDRIA